MEKIILTDIRVGQRKKIKNITLRLVFSKTT
jgi:hypothetical protein